MGNNAEIRQRMETYRTILLVLNWVGSVALLIFGFVLANSRYTRGIGIGVIICSPILGIIGHFFVNAALAIPFILLNNGDILESLKGKLGSTMPAPVAPSNVSPEEDPEPSSENVVVDENADTKNIEIERLEKLFESTTDENEKGIIAKKLYDLGKTYYWRFIPKDKK